jgi:hypothetical protein
MCAAILFVLQIWDLRSDALLQHYRAHTGGVTSVAFHPSGNFLLTSSLDTTLKVRGRHAGPPRGPQPCAAVPHQKGTRRANVEIRLLPEHAALCPTPAPPAPGPTWAPQIWDLQEGQLFYTLHGHEGATNSVAFSPAGDYFASAGADEQVRPGPGALAVVAPQRRRGSALADTDIELQPFSRFSQAPGACSLVTKHMQHLSLANTTLCR